ncbi:MAG: M15 family metallopeptidase [Leucobacter sp.]
MQKRHIPGALAAILVCGLALVGCAGAEAEPRPTQAAVEPSPTASEPDPTPEPEPEFDRALHPIDDPMSIWVVSNKRRPLNPIDAVPGDLSMPVGVENEFSQPLREPAARAVEALVAEAYAAGHTVRIISAYRDYGTQSVLYNGYIARDGQAAADTYSARPGHSEHQTGLAVDFDDFGSCYLNPCFGETPAGAWLAEHAAAYGFIVRYPAGMEHITGFMPEPWHFRYVGPELATEMKRTGTTTLEEFFGLEPAPDYGG